MLVMMLVNVNNNRSLICFDEKEHFIFIISLIFSNPKVQITYLGMLHSLNVLVQLILPSKLIRSGTNHTKLSCPHDFIT